MNLEIAYPPVLSLLPLALLPFFRPDRMLLRYSWLALMPRDHLATAVGVLLKVVAAIAIAALILGLSGLRRSEGAVERVGHGAQIVVLLDRSRSMDESFNQGRVNHDPSKAFNEEQAREIKGKAARKILAEFASKRSQDMFGMVVFSSYPMRILDFTQKQEVIQAAIRAGDVGRGLSETDLARGLLSALTFFDNEPYTASRIILIVSDGGARIDDHSKRRLALQMRRNRVGLYWIYLRSFHSPGLFGMPRDSVTENEASAELALHEFFSSLGSPYQAYEAENSNAIQRAIQDVNRLENQPMTFKELVPRRDLSWECYLVATLMLTVLIASKFMEIRPWR
ncbi:MAG: vWA domain-containing protein [Burkholderiales bacterium]